MARASLSKPFLSGAIDQIAVRAWTTVVTGPAIEVEAGACFILKKHFINNTNKLRRFRGTGASKTVALLDNSILHYMDYDRAS